LENTPFLYQVILTDINIIFLPLTTTLVFGIILSVVLLFLSALVSGSEVAFFSLTPNDIENLKNSKSNVAKTALKLLESPRKLLATILVSNNFINIAIVILSTYLMNSLINFGGSQIIGFIIQVVLITFLLLLFGEIIPKVYANKYSSKFALSMAIPLQVLSFLFKPVTSILVSSARFLDKYFKKKQSFSINDLSSALEIASDGLDEEKEILKGIVEFGNTEVSEIMRPRVDVLAIDISSSFSDVLNNIVDDGYSRIPVFDKSFDDIKGILYIKDLLPHIQKKNNFHWQSLIRPPYFIPEKKKINDLLEELQKKKIHMAIVVDEYGGTSGIVTMEDIIEEIVGDISDEFDEDEVNFSKINKDNFLFDGKILLNDFYKIVDADNSVFDDIKGDADTLAGLILEIKGEFPKLYDKIVYKQFTFTIEEIDKRRIVKIKTTIDR